VEDTLSSKGEELKITRGRKVMEIRPKVNWHKGTALNHLLTVLDLKNQPDVVSIYIGDDRTDEDAFRVLREESQGYGILVSSKVKDTTAFYTVKDPGEVELLLKGLVTWATSTDNGWIESYGEGGMRSLQGSAAELLKWKQWQQKSLSPA
jgi:trehalose 6-phosphate phosphatase